MIVHRPFSSESRTGIHFPHTPFSSRPARAEHQHASACPSGQNAETKFSSSLFGFFGGAREIKNGEENFVEALPPFCGGAEASIISGFVFWICESGLVK